MSALARAAVALLAATALAGAAPRPSQTGKADNRRPNILFVLVDDMGFGDLSLTGNRAIATPNIDRLAADGIVMTQFYDPAPICSASRAGFMTGQFPARNGFVSFIGSRAENARSGQADWLDPKLATIPAMLRAAGYATGHFGKWHLGGGRDIGDAPLVTDYGFDESYTQFEGLGARVVPSDVDGQMLKLARQSEALGRGSVDRLPRHAITARYVDKSLDFIARNRARPWFVQLWLDDPHAPWQPSLAQLAATGGKGRDDNERKFLAVLAAMDQQVGRLVAELRQLGELDDTLIVLTSDNGPNSVARFYRDGGQPPGSAAPYRGRKDSLYEGGIRQPLIVRWPGRIAPRQRDETTVAHGVDLFPTLAAVVGARTRPGGDGVDLLPAWRGRPITRSRDLFWTYGAFGTYEGSPRAALPIDRAPGFAVRSGKWKLLADDERAELYDLNADPAESRNLAGSQPAIMRRLSAKLSRWRQSLPKRLVARQSVAPAVDLQSGKSD